MTMIRTFIPAAALAMAVAMPGFADEEVEEMASEEEIGMINEALAQFNCEEVEEAEKESANLFELDDAVCEAGQYDIKLDGEFTVTSMTYDGPVDD